MIRLILSRLYILLLLMIIPCIFYGQTFVQAQEEAGIDHAFDHSQFNGGGGAFADIDNDGDDDLYINGGKSRDVLYINNGDGTFTDITEGSGIEETANYYTTGVIAGDINNDGYIDFFIGTYGDQNNELAKNLLYQNNGNGTFTEIWNETQPKDLAFTMGATFLDFNLDGYLDIYVVNYVEVIRFTYDENNLINGFDHDCFRNTFYKNNGDGTFDEISYHLGLDNTGCALAVTSTDFNMDHLMDIYIANDFGAYITPNQLFQNNLNDNGKFQNVSIAQGADFGMFGMGIAIGDVDNDLDPDYYISNMGRNILARNDITEFVDITTESGVENIWEVEDEKPTIGWGTSFLDADNDTDLDLYIANGYVPGPGFINTSVLNHDQLYINDGNGKFSLDPDVGIENAYSTRGVSCSDYDLDGDVDILAVVHNKPDLGESPKCILFKNTTINDNNWVKVKLEGVYTNRNAYGSKIYVHSGGQTYFQESSGGSSHNSQNSSWLHFGLGDLASIDSIRIIWTGDVSRQTVYNPEINTSHYIIQDVSDIVGTNDELIRQQLTVSPNPFTEEFLINSSIQENSVLSITSLNGKLIDRFNFEGPINQKIDMRTYPSGMYLIIIRTDKQVYYKKVIKS